MAKRRNYSTDFKARGGGEGSRGGGREAESGGRCGRHPRMITKGKRQGLTGVKEGFGRNITNRDSSREGEIKTLQAKVGELIVERDFLAKAFDR